MEKKLKFVFFAIEINLILWILAFIFVHPETFALGRKIVVVSCVISAILQHWAYYNIYKEFKKK